MTAALPPVTVALPIHRPDPNRLTRALASITAQTHDRLEILLLPNGCSPAELLLINDLAQHDPRCRIAPLPEASLAAAVNHALRIASHDLVARQDADDLSAPTRLEMQARAMVCLPELAALGCGWTTIDRHTSAVRCTTKPPTDPRDARTSLLTGNPFAHGSMMLRRDAVRAAGGYDESLTRAQDYDLWARLAPAGAIAAIPDVLYHWTHHGQTSHASSPAQARAHAQTMLRAWRMLDPQSQTTPDTDRSTAARAELESAIARVLVGEATPDVLDHILRWYIEDHLPLDTIVTQTGYDAALVGRILRMVDRNEYKRRQAAPGLRVTTKAFGLGRRMPIVMKRTHTTTADVAA